MNNYLPIVPTELQKDTLIRSFFNSIRDRLNGKIKLPIYTTTERDAITTWDEGDFIFNKTEQKLNYRKSASWGSV